MKNYAIHVICSTILLLAGCASDPAYQQRQAAELMEYKLQVYGSACEKLGFNKDTNEWRDCIQREYEQSLLRQQRYRDYQYWNPYYESPYYYRRH
jgi:hypothetical protein